METGVLSDPSVLEECSKGDLERQSQRLSWRIGEAFSHWFCSNIDLLILDQFDLRNSLSYLLTVYLVYLSTAANFNYQRCFEHSAHDFQKSIMSPGIHPRASIFFCKLIKYKHCQVAERGGRCQRCQSTHIRIGGATERSKRQKCNETSSFDIDQTRLTRPSYWAVEFCRIPLRRWSAWSAQHCMWFPRYLDWIWFMIFMDHFKCDYL